MDTNVKEHLDPSSNVLDQSCTSDTDNRANDTDEKFEIKEDAEAVKEEHLTEEQQEEIRKECLELKKVGNDHFKAQEYEEAIKAYTEGIEKCLNKFAQDKAILFANTAACYFKMGEHSQVILNCTSALELDPMYLKARLRRAQSYEATEKLDEAFEDYKLVLEQDRTNKVAGEACMRLPEQIKERNEKLKAEMLGKLKDLGNMVLKPFGLSTDNFNLQQDPNTGGYSVNFQK